MVFVSDHIQFTEIYGPLPGVRRPLADYNFLGSRGFIQGNSDGPRIFYLEINSKFFNCIGECPSVCVSRTSC